MDRRCRHATRVLACARPLCLRCRARRACAAACRARASHRCRSTDQGSVRRRSPTRLRPRVARHALGATIRELGLGRPVLMGHSWGGGVVTTLAGRHPGEVRGLVLLDSGHIDYADLPAARSSPDPVTWEWESRAAFTAWLEENLERSTPELLAGYGAGAFDRDGKVFGSPAESMRFGARRTARPAFLGVAGALGRARPPLPRDAAAARRPEPRAPAALPGCRPPRRRALDRRREPRRDRGRRPAARRSDCGWLATIGDAARTGV